MSIKEVNNFLKTKSFHASKKMGQNFLVNKQIKDRIVKAAHIEPKDIVLEIGPGVGAITGVLLTYKIKLVAIELDKRLADLLTTKFSGYNNFNLHNLDALKTNWDELLSPYATNQVKIIANLPYSISSLLILKIIKSTCIHEGVIMVQKEMAERLSARVGTHAYNMFSVLVQLFLDVQKLFDVSPTSFSPTPKVMSSVIKITRKNTTPDLDFATIDYFLHLVFANKRKTLVNNLSIHYPKEQVVNILINLGWKLTVRAEELTPLELVQLMKALNND